MEKINLITIAIPFFFLLIGLELFFSWYKKRGLYRLNDSINDLSAGVSSQIFGIIFKTIIFLAYLWVYQNWRIFDLPAWPSERVSWMPSHDLLGISVGTWSMSIVLFVWVACFVLYDLAYYWNHRLSHEVNFLWAGHVVHHQSEEYNLTVALRQASFHSLFSWVFYLPLALLGFPPIVTILNGELNLIYQFWIHTKAIDKLPSWFEAIFNTPSHHRVHHGINPKYIDKNHGGTLIVFDKWFGTFQKEEEVPVYGTVKPLRSFNPLWANVHYWWEMFELAWKSSRWIDKIKVFVAVPGWRPQELGGQYPIPEVSEKTFKKYDVSLPTGLTAYSLVWFAATVAGTFAMLVKISVIPVNVQYTIFILSFLSLISIGGILDLKRWALYMEPARLAILIATAILFGFSKANLAIIGGLVFLSVAWFLLYRQSFSSWKEIDPSKEIQSRTA
ncbi:fatty acid hydroxylase family protein [Leptospira broomii serovar Hurstbridge str. 5399]|uniref:Fatty acid hydroxylase family protein n=1 Tax=Leptospira broomii serovar Hurstbridge str. 5399 TaxID=1049789 RepID=T0GGE6_9LEPT|nr:sterol desaturase family protein [Leptospira broomii]EQA45929.1 fatty acid hydroxylase family protein [Leptospira broomii serovar Hurstbridge str. 5399]